MRDGLLRPTRSEMGFFLNSPILFDLAKDAYLRALRGSTNDTSPDTNDPLVSIVLAAASCEAFIQEIAEMASSEAADMAYGGGVQRISQDPPQISAFADVAAEIDLSHGPTTLKFLLAKLIFSGKAFDKGALPYQDFELLLALRNSVMHLKFDRISITPVRVQFPPIITRLRSKNILATLPENDEAVSWIRLVSTPAVARWACNTAATMVATINDAIPQSDLKGLVAVHVSRFTAIQVGGVESTS